MGILERMKKREFDNTVRLSKKEVEILKKATTRIMDSIVKREKDPVKRRLLKLMLPQEIAFLSTMYVIHAEIE